MAEEKTYNPLPTCSECRYMALSGKMATFHGEVAYVCHRYPPSGANDPPQVNSSLFFRCRPVISPGTLGCGEFSPLNRKKQ